jgi:hypothetical protein
MNRDDLVNKLLDHVIHLEKQITFLQDELNMCTEDHTVPELCLLTKGEALCAVS